MNLSFPPCPTFSSCTTSVGPIFIFPKAKQRWRWGLAVCFRPTTGHFYLLPSSDCRFPKRSRRLTVWAIIPWLHRCNFFLLFLLSLVYISPNMWVKLTGLCNSASAKLSEGKISVAVYCRSFSHVAHYAQKNTYWGQQEFCIETECRVGSQNQHCASESRSSPTGQQQGARTEPRHFSSAVYKPRNRMEWNSGFTKGHRAKPTAVQEY